MPQDKPRVVIVGGGFGGLNAARELEGAPVQVTLIDRRNHHLFQPLLYQVATAALNPSDIAVPLRHILRRQRNLTVLLGEAASIDAAARRVVLTDGEVPYDSLILATGATHSYFGHDDWTPFAPGLKSLEDALEIRRRVLLAYEAAERETDPGRRREWLTFVVVGAGPTGVELAGALGEISRHALAKDFRNIDPKQARILLLEGGPRILPTFPQELSEKAVAALQRLGVEVRAGAMVTRIGPEGVQIGEERIGTYVVLWAAGVAASPLARSLGAPLDRAGRVVVTPELTVPGRPEVFVIGDLASLVQDGAPVPGIAPAAIQGGRHAARMIRRALGGLPAEPFRYKDRGTLATVGRGAGLANFPRMKFNGMLGWWAWLFIHLLFLVGFRNRLLVLIQWAWAFVTFQRGARLITGHPLLPEDPRHGRGS